MQRVCLICLATVLLGSLISMSCSTVPAPPATPTGLTCQWISSSQIDVSWDASTGADGYYVYRCEGANCTPTTQVHTASGTSWSDIQLNPNTNYCYMVTAYNEAGESNYSPTACCTTDDNPEVTWNKAFGGSSYDNGYSLRQTSDGGYIIVGCTESYGAGNADIWLIKTDSSGNEMWNKTFGGLCDDYGYSIDVEHFDEGYLIVGCTESYGAGNADGWLIKVTV